MASDETRRVVDQENLNRAHPLVAGLVRHARSQTKCPV